MFVDEKNPSDVSIIELIRTHAQQFAACGLKKTAETEEFFKEISSEVYF